MAQEQGVTIVETGLDPGRNTRSSTTHLVVHHTSGSAGIDPDAATINEWHKGKGWNGIGYHYVIRKNGTIERGAPADQMGSHCYKCNDYSVGIHVGGDFMLEEPTNEQLASLKALLISLCNLYSIAPSRETIKGHQEMPENVGETDCPGNNLLNKLDSIVQEVVGKTNGTAGGSSSGKSNGSNNSLLKKASNSLVAGMGFDCKYVGETVTITKLPKGKTYPCEPIYPDWITVGDTIPQWIMSTTVAKVNQKNAEALNSTSSSDILTSEEASDIKSSIKNIKNEINKTEEASYEKWCAANNFDYSDKTEENQAKIKAAYNEALKADEAKPESERMFMNGYYHGGDTVIKESLTKINEKKNTLNELSTKLANSKKKEEEQAKAAVEKEYGSSKNKEAIKEKNPEKESSASTNNSSSETIPSINKKYSVNKNIAFEILKKYSTKITGNYSDYLMTNKITFLSDTAEITIKCLTPSGQIVETGFIVIKYTDNSISHKRGLAKDIPDNENMSYINIS